MLLVISFYSICACFFNIKDYDAWDFIFLLISMKKIGILGLICVSLLVASCNKNAKTETPETPVTPNETPTIETPV